MPLVIRTVPQALMVLKEMPLEPSCDGAVLHFDRYSIVILIETMTAHENAALREAIDVNRRTLVPLAQQYHALDAALSIDECPLRAAHRARLHALCERYPQPTATRLAEERDAEQEFEDARQVLFAPLHALGARADPGADGKTWNEYLDSLAARGFNTLTAAVSDAP